MQRSVLELGKFFARCGLSKIQPFLFATLACLVLASSIAAEANAQRLVVPNEYIITPAIAASTAGAGDVANHFLAPHGLTVKAPLSNGSKLLVTPDAGMVTLAQASAPYDDSDRVCQSLITSGVAAACEQNQLVSHFATTPNDPRLGELWGLIDSAGIDAPRAWDRHTGSSQVVVAVVDTGLDYTHPDLAANAWVNPGEIPNNNIDDDGNGVIDDVHGYNAITNSGNPMDDNSHGTHVSGTIGARGNNANGVVGVNWDVRIMGLKFLSSNGSGSIAGAIRAIDYMVMMKRRGVNIRVSNNSWGGPGFSQALKEAIDRAASEGIIFVAAAGNESNDNDHSGSYPANYEASTLVSVAATDRQRNLASFSNYGASTVDIAAPGVGILSTVPGGGYASYSGTSMATPHVAGALALLLAYEPALSASQAIQRLYDTGVSFGTLQGVVRTARALNVGRLLANDAVPLPPDAPAPAPCPYGIAQQGDAIDRSADSGILLMERVDEFNFKTVSLPFPFTFDGVAMQSVVVSPNGVLYFGAAPSSMDWQNSSKAPVRSIAVLHTDLVSSVRVQLSSEQATFYWNSSLYTNPGLGHVEARLTLYADGTAKQWVSYSSGAIENIIKANVTVGIQGRTEQSLATYSFNDRKATDGLALQYVPLCGSGGGAPDGSLKVDSVRVWGLSSSGSKQKVLTPGERIAIKIRPSDFSGTGSAVASLRLDGQLCAAAPQVTIVPGHTATLRGRLSSRFASFRVRELAVSVAGATGKRRIANPRSSGVSRRALNQKRFETLCSSISQRLRMRR